MPLRSLFLLPLLTLAACGGSDEQAATRKEQPVAASAQNVLTGTYDRLDGTPQDLSEYRGKAVLVVNTASECGFTPQFKQLQALYTAKRKDGFVILGFPADDVAGQEPRSDAEIKDFCEKNFGVEFPMFSKVNVTGDAAIPLFKALGEPDWNFNKYLVDKQGKLVKRWGAGTTPDDPDLLAALDGVLS
jgi:glutathione peroxidase